MKEVLGMNKKLKKNDKILLGVLIALIIIVIGVGAFLIIRNTNSANEQAKKLTPSSSATSSVTSETKSSSSKTSSKKTGSKTSSDKTSSSSTTSKTSSASLSSSSAGTSTSSKASSTSTSSKTSSKSNVKGDKMKREKPKGNTSHASKKELKVNGTTCYVGDTISVVLNITSQKSIVNYQGTMGFDTKYLKLKETKSNSIGLVNGGANEIMFNASSINGMNFSETGTVFTATFEVLAEGSTELKDNMEIISELIDNNIKQLSPTDYTVSIDVIS